MANVDAEAIEEPETDASLSAVEDDTANRHFRLWLLFAAHVMLGQLFSIWSAAQGRRPFVLEHLLAVPGFGFILAQSSLLGFWAMFSPAKWWMRLPGLIMGIIYLEFLLGIGTPGDALTGLLAMATGGMVAVLGLVRWRYADLRRFPQPAVQTGQGELKMSIRGLMLFTFVVAITIIGVNELREHASAGPNVLATPILSLCFVVVGLSGVWAGLGLTRPKLRSVVVLLISAVLGSLFVYAIKRPDWETHFRIVSIMLLQAGVLIASLLVVRSCGYRLVQKSNPELEPLD